MSLRSILTGISEIGQAYHTLRAQKRQFEHAMDVATDQNRIAGKVMIDPEQIVEVNGGQVIVYDDGSSRRAALVEHLPK